MPAIILKASILEKQGDEDAAALQLKRAESFQSPWLAARDAMRVGDWKRAIAAYTELERDTEPGELYIGSSLDLLLGRGAAYLKAGQCEKAIEDFSAAKDEWKESLEAALLLGKAWYLQREEDHAEEVLRNLYERAIHKDEVALGIAAVYRRCKAFKNGLEWTCRIKEESLKLRSQMVFRIRLGQLSAAVEEGEEVTRRYPADARAWSNLGWAYDKLGEKDKAVRALRKAIAIDRTDLRAHVNLEGVYVARGQLDLAIEHSMAAAELGLFESEYRILGRAYQLKGEKEKADKWFRDGLKLYSKGLFEQNMHEDGFHYLVACFLDLQKRHSEALKHAGRCFETRNDPDETAALIHIGILLGRLGSSEVGDAVDELIGILRKEVARREAREEVWYPVLYTLALALVHRAAEGDVTEALEWARAAVGETEEKNPHILAGLAQVQYKAEDFAGAVVTLEKALRLPGANPHLEVTLHQYRQKLLPEVASYTSVDDYLKLGKKVVLVRRGAEWRFFRGTVEPPAGWKVHDFDDSSWDEGPAGFGYGLSFHNYRTEIDGMVGSCSTLYVRNVFPMEDPGTFGRLALYVWADDGFVAYLNGVEVSRARAGPRGAEVPHDRFAASSSAGLLPVRARIDPSRLREGRNCLAIQGLNQRDWQATFYLSAILIGEAPPAVEDAHDVLEEFRSQVEGQEGKIRVACLEGRLLHRHGKFVQAVEKLTPVLPFFPNDPELWNLWWEMAAGKLELSSPDVLGKLSPIAAMAPDSYAADALWGLEQLGESGSLRINCGGGRYKSAAGEVWGRDRFFRGGQLFRRGEENFAGDIGGTDDDLLYQSERWFPPEAFLAGYRIPLPNGAYDVTLLFAEIWHREPERRRFDVAIEGRTVLGGYAPIKKGFATADTYRSESVSVDDGFLDIRFIPRVENPKISAIEIKRLD